jgi:hypothetical protein
MTNKPDFWLAYKALAQIRNTMVHELMGRFFAFQAYYYGFNDKNIVMNSVLVGIPNAEQIYSDENFGFDSFTKLYYWMKALLDGQGSASYNQLMAYF